MEKQTEKKMKRKQQPLPDTHLHILKPVFLKQGVSSTQQQTQNFELVANKELYCQVVGDGRGNSVLGLPLGFSGFLRVL